MDKTRHPKIFVGRFRAEADDGLDGALEELAALARAGTAERIRDRLARLLPEAQLTGRDEEERLAAELPRTRRRTSRTSRPPASPRPAGENRRAGDGGSAYPRRPTAATASEVWPEDSRTTPSAPANRPRVRSRTPRS